MFEFSHIIFNILYLVFMMIGCYYIYLLIRLAPTPKVWKIIWSCFYAFVAFLPITRVASYFLYEGCPDNFCEHVLVLYLPTIGSVAFTVTFYLLYGLYGGYSVETKKKQDLRDEQRDIHRDEGRDLMRDEIGDLTRDKGKDGERL